MFHIYNSALFTHHAAALSDLAGDELVDPHKELRAGSAGCFVPGVAGPASCRIFMLLVPRIASTRNTTRMSPGGYSKSTGIPIIGQTNQTKKPMTIINNKLAGSPYKKNSPVVNCLLL